MRILLTGGSGLVGSRIKEMWHTGVEIVDGSLTAGYDLLDEKVLVQLTKEPFDAVIHLAAFTDVAKAEEQVGDKGGMCYRLNVELTKKLLEKVKLHDGGQFVLMSTGYVFDGALHGGEKYIEKDETNPQNWYAETKLMSENLLRESGLDFTILRIHFPFRNRFEKKVDWVWQTADKLKDRSLPPQFTDRWFSCLWVDDLTRGLQTVLHNAAGNDVYHFCGNECLTHFEAAQMIAERIGMSSNVVEKGKLSAYIKAKPVAKKLFPRNSCLSSEKFQKHYNFAFTDFTDALDEILKK